MIGSAARHGWIVAFSVGVLLAACGDDAPEKPKDTKPAVGAANAKARGVTDNMVAAVAAGKSSAIVGVYFMLGNSPQVDTALPVDIAILPHRDFSSVRALFDVSGGGLTLISGDAFEPIENAKAESPLAHKLVLMPQQAGVYVVTVNLETVGAEGTVSRVFSIPVIVAPAAGAAAESAPGTTPAPASN
jgi:hypothetical protein